MRIAIINHGIFPFLMGGMERHTHCLASAMAAQGAEVEVLVPELQPDQLRRFAETRQSYRLVQFPWPEVWPWLRANYLFSRNAAAYLHSSGFDAIYCQGFNAWAYLKSKPAGQGPLTLFNPHGLEMFKMTGMEAIAKSFPMRWAAREQARLADRVVSLGGGMTDETRRFLGVARDKIDILPNAVDITYIDGFARPHRVTQTTRFIFAGRLEHIKGAAYLCEAFMRVEDAHLMIAGSGPLGDKLRRRFAHPQIEFTGRLYDDELFKRYRESDGFVLPSLCEGMPTVILEAMAVGLPVIATDIGAVRTMVDAENGFVVAPGSASRLAGAINAFLQTSPERRARMGRASRRRVEQYFTWPRIATLTLETIEKHLAARPGR